MTSPLRLPLIAVVVFLPATVGLFAEEQKISCGSLPSEVRAAFNKSFSRASINGCAKDVEKGKTTYEIMSMEGEARRNVRFHADGKLMEVEELIALSDVPEPAKQAVNKKYPGGEITLVEKGTRDTGVLYEFRLKHRSRLVEVYFDADGKEVTTK